MKLGPVTKPSKKNTATSKQNKTKKKNDEVMSENCNVFFPIHGQFTAIAKPNSGRMVYKTYIFNNNNLLSYNNWK